MRRLLLMMGRIPLQMRRLRHIPGQERRLGHKSLPRKGLAPPTNSEGSKHQACGERCCPMPLRSSRLRAPMTLAVLVASVVPIIGLTLWDSPPDNHRVPPLLYIAAFAWMCVGLAALSWLE